MPKRAFKDDGRSDPASPRYAIPHKYDPSDPALLLAGIGLMVRAIDGERGLEALPALLKDRAHNG